MERNAIKPDADCEVNMQCTDEKGLYEAARCGNIEELKRLRRSGYLFARHWGRARFYAINCDQLEALQYLSFIFCYSRQEVYLRHGSELLFSTAQDNAPRCAEWLLNCGVDIDTRYRHMEALKFGRLDLTATEVAAIYDSHGVLTFFLDAGGGFDLDPCKLKVETSAVIHAWRARKVAAAAVAASTRGRSKAYLSTNAPRSGGRRTCAVSRKS